MGSPSTLVSDLGSHLETVSSDKRNGLYEILWKVAHNLCLHGLSLLTFPYGKGESYGEAEG